MIAQKTVYRFSHCAHRPTRPPGGVKNRVDRFLQGVHDPHGQAANEQRQRIENTGQVHRKERRDEHNEENDILGEVELSGRAGRAPAALAAEHIQAPAHGAYPPAEDASEQSGHGQNDQDRPEEPYKLSSGRHGGDTGKGIDGKEGVDGPGYDILPHVPGVEEQEQEEDTEHPLGSDAEPTHTEIASKILDAILNYFRRKKCVHY